MSNLSLRRHRQPYYGRRTIWTDDKWTLAQQMKRDGATLSKIAKAVGLTVSQVDYRFRNEFIAQQTIERRARDAAVMVEADGRLDAAARQSLTAQLCGDPIPGRSALDQKRQTQPTILNRGTE